MAQRETPAQFLDPAGAPATGTAPESAQMRQRSKLLQQRLADAGLEVVEWDQIAGTDEFRALLAARARFIVPATAFFLAYYFALPLLVGYAPGVMKTQVVGVVNLAYLYALSQFAMTWILAYLFVRRCRGFDAMAQAIAAKAKKPGRRT